MLGDIHNITEKSIDPVVKSHYLIWELNPIFQAADLYFTEKSCLAQHLYRVWRE
jgi:hypothetical protein